MFVPIDTGYNIVKIVTVHNDQSTYWYIIVQAHIVIPVQIKDMHTERQNAALRAQSWKLDYGGENAMVIIIEYLTFINTVTVW